METPFKINDYITVVEYIIYRKQKLFFVFIQLGKNFQEQDIFFFYTAK